MTKRFKGFISQVGKNNPTIGEHSVNEIGNFVYEWSVVGTYLIRCFDNPFTEGTTFFSITDNTDGAETKIKAAWIDESMIRIQTFDANGQPADSILGDTPLYIEVEV